MEIFIFFLSLIQSIAIGLGVGSSTIAIANFFTAIYDGTIDQHERRMMKVTYVVLRVAMILILTTTLTLLALDIYRHGLAALTPTVLGQVTILFVLYTNAILMTLKVMPSSVGPALQASSWYTLGILNFLIADGLDMFNFTQFVLGYVAFFLFAAACINGGMHYLKQIKNPA